MKKKYLSYILPFMAAGGLLQAQTVNIQIDASKGRKTISPYIYGRNNSISDNPGSAVSAATWKMMREAGLRYTRENGGNNATKYNWRKKLSSHPDWYNNVYAHDWDYAAKTLSDSMPGVQGMWAFQLIGWAASNTNNNFNDNAYNGSAWWTGTQQNLAGGGIPNAGGGPTATTEGNPSLYLEHWTADSTTAILDHWFGTSGLGYNKNNIKYWSMDNEPDIWNSTHDDVMKTQPAAEAFMQLYFAVAKKARAKYPNIKLTGPVPASEWQWYSWNNNKITVGNQSYVWLEFFIKRCAEEQTASGIRLLDVIDIHSYPNETADTSIVQLHRLYFDTTYNYPGANGVKTTAANGWDNTITKEYVFGRCNKWLNQYMGPNHGVTFAVSEYGATNNSATVTANSYASVLGTFADNGVEFFTPWYWYPGMWETLHLYSRYAKSTRVQSVSSNEHDVSSYASVNAAGDSMTVVLVNRSTAATHAASISLSNFNVANGSYPTKRLSSLPSTETFVSHGSNALVSGTAAVSANALSISLPPLSITAVLLKGSLITGIATNKQTPVQARLYPNPVQNGAAYIDLSASPIAGFELQVYNALGEVVYVKSESSGLHAGLEIPCADLAPGLYFIRLSTSDGRIWNSRLLKN
jgi:hypothetical protein